MLNHIIIWQPAAFLILLPLLALFTMRRLPSRIQNFLRVLTYCMIAAAMGGVSVRLPERAGTLVVLADRSRSMPEGSRQEMDALIHRLEKSAPDGSKLSVISFAESPFVEKLPDSPAFDGLHTVPANPHATDIAGAIESARGVKLERGQLNLPDQLKEVGSYDAKIDLGEGVFAPFKVQIVEEAAERPRLP